MRKRIDIYIKKLTALMISAVLLICSTDIGAAAGSYFVGNVFADEPDIPVEGISIDVYGSKLKYSSNGLKRYEHYYCFTVTTDSNGSFSFLRPTSKTLLKIDLDTLPYGTGVNEQTRLVASGYEDTFGLSYVNDINIVKSRDGSVYRVDLTSADGSLLSADYDVTDTVTTSASDITYDTLNSVKLDRTVTVSAAGLSKSRTFQLDISDHTVSGKLSTLRSYGLIDENAQQSMIGDYSVDTASPEDPRPDFLNERRYISRSFMMHSEWGTANVEQYERILDEIVDVYFRKYDFLEPYHEYISGSTTIRDNYFHIYLVDPDVIRIDSEVSPKNVVGKTMKIDPADASKGCYVVLSPTDPMQFKWVLSHELFHCIMYRYIGKNQAGWFKESFANYGSLLCLNGSPDYTSKHLSRYLKSAGYPLSSSSVYKNRQYGIFILPLYIHDKFGGVQTIKNILTAYANTSNAYKAIDKGLKATKSTYSFSKLYAGFKDMNAYTEAYRLNDLSSGEPPKFVNKKATRTMTSSFEECDTAITPRMTLTGNSSAYFEFEAPPSQSGTLTVTVDTSEGASNASYNLILKGKSIIIPARGNASELMTFVLSGLGDKYSSAVLTAGNTSMSSKQDLSFTASVYFEAK